jgi:hypothetical protein
MTGWTFVGSVLLLAVAYLLMSGFLTAWRRFRGTRVITCPENLEPAAVRVDALQAAKWQAIAGETSLRLTTCSRWPEMQGCGQECLSQIEAAPEQCLVRNIVARWYTGKHCVYCGEGVGEIVWHERPPALRAPDKTSREWKEIAPEQLPVVFATYQPVCWKCHVLESFRREHPDLVVERRHPAEPHPVLQPSVAVY